MMDCGRNVRFHEHLLGAKISMKISMQFQYLILTSGYAMWFTAGCAIRIAHYDVIDDVITWKL